MGGTRSWRHEVSSLPTCERQSVEAKSSHFDNQRYERIESPVGPVVIGSINGCD